MESLNSNSQERELHQLQQMQHKAKESCMKSFRLIHSHLKVLSINDLKRPGSKGGYEWAFASLFDQDVQTFTSTMLLNLDQLKKQLDKEEFQEDRSMTAFWYFAEYTRIEVKQFRETLLQHMGNVKKSVAERTRHKRQYDSRMNERQMQSKEGKVDSSKALDDSLVVTECSAIESENSNSEHAFNKSVYESSGTESGKQDTSSSSRNYLTHVVDADIRLVNDQVPFVEVDSNTTPDSTNMCHRGGEIDHDAKQYQVKKEGKKKIQDRNRIPNPRDMASARTYRTPNACTPKPRNISSSTWSRNVYEMVKLTTGYISLGLVQNLVSPTTYVSPSKRDYEIMFQQLFDEYFNPAPCAVSPDPVAVAAPRPVDLAGSPSSTTIDQDVSSASTSPTNQEIQSQVTHQDPSSEETTLQGAIPSNLHHLNQSFDTLTKLTKNHPLENVIGDPSRPVSTRSQLQVPAIWCYFDVNDNPIPFGGKRSG
ncbi:hypothetical protein Tco_1085128 [Tanacetum coccineum]